MRTVPLGGDLAAGRVALVDDEDYDLVIAYRWHITQTRSPSGVIEGPYAKAHHWRGGRRTTIMMHNLIMGRDRVDHRNHDGLDNRRANLRQASAAQNNQNARKRAGGTSRYKGVVRRASQKMYQARIHVNGVVIHLGSFADEEDAARAYDSAARRLFGEFAYTNFPD